MIGGVHARLGAEGACATPRILEEEIHCCQNETRVMECLELFGCGVFRPSPPSWRNDHGAYNDLAIWLIGEQLERSFSSYVEDRLMRWRIQDALGARTAAPPDPGQCAEKEDVISRNSLDCTENPLRRRVHAGSVILAELVFRNELVKQ